jgi:hypothetical protein
MILQDIDPHFVSLYANETGQWYFFDEGKHTTNLASLSMTNLKAADFTTTCRGAEKDSRGSFNRC